MGGTLSTADVEILKVVEATLVALAEQFSTLIDPGQTLLLSGDLGAGKSTFARALISQLLLIPEDIPSPTYTLIQTYDTHLGPLIHADLYRLGAPDEILELGLEDAFGQSICVVEWPDRLGPYEPQDKLSLHISQNQDPDTRDLRLSAQGATSRKLLSAVQLDA